MKKLFMHFAWVFIIAAIGSTACDYASNNAASNNGTNRTNVNVAYTTPVNSNTVVANSNSAAPGGGFLAEAASGGMTEVELGKIASSKAQNPEVKKFAEMMVADHTKANDELKALAVKKNITLPSTPNATHQATIQKFQGMSGAGFDKAYVDDMVEDHEKDVAEFEKQSQSNPDADIKAFAAKTLPTLKKHLDEIKAIHGKMK